VAFTYFWRDLQTLQNLIRTMMARYDGKSAIHVWDAGCAQGQEPYTLLILMAEMLPHSQFEKVEVWATDYDPGFGDIVREAVYSDEEFERVPGDILQRYFRPDSPGRQRVRDSIRQRLHYRRHDLLTLKPVNWSFQAILCKNVLLHFVPPQRVEVVRMLHQALIPRGLLATEQTQKLPDAAMEYFRQLTADTQLHEKV